MSNYYASECWCIKLADVSYVSKKSKVAVVRGETINLSDEYDAFMLAMQEYIENEDGLIGGGGL